MLDLIWSHFNVFIVTYFYLVSLAPILDKCVPFLFCYYYSLLFFTDIYIFKLCDGVGVYM